MEEAGAAVDRTAAVHALEPLLQRALDGPGWTDARYAARGDDGRPGYRYYHNADGSLTIYGVLFRPGHPTPVHDHVTWGLIGVYSGQQRTTRYRRLDAGTTPGLCRVEEQSDAVLTHGATYPLLPPHDIHRIEVVGAEEGLSIHVLGAICAGNGGASSTWWQAPARRSKGCRWRADAKAGRRPDRSCRRCRRNELDAIAQRNSLTECESASRPV